MQSPTPFDPAALATQLQLMTLQQCLLFALSCTERLLPNYAAFAIQSGWGSPGILREALDFAWDATLASALPVSVPKELRRRVVDAEPETTEHTTILVSAALDAAAATGIVLDMLATGERGSAVEVAALGRDTVDMYVQAVLDLAPSDPDFEQKILRHELMVRELRRQAADLTALQSATEDAEALLGIGQALRQPSVGSLGL